MAKEYQRNDDLQALMSAVRLTYDELEPARGARIAVLAKPTRKTGRGKIVYADCTKVTSKMKALMSYDFVITFYGDAISCDAQTQERIMYHELLHVGFDAETGKCRIVPHDLEDFKSCVDRWGTDWVHGGP